MKKVARVGCAGILVEDTFCGPMPALPAEGALLALGAMPVKAGGCASNVAIDLARQAIGVDVVGCVGKDVGAVVLREAFTAQNVDCTRIVRLDEYETSKCVILLVEGQDRRYLYVPGANSGFKIEHISKEWLSGLEVFYLGGLFGLPGIDLRELVELLRFCRESGVRTVVDVIVPQDHSGMDSLGPLLPLIDLFVPNEDEARSFTKLADPNDQLRAFAAAGARSVVITCGAKGAVALDRDVTWTCGAYVLDVVDPSGSGDAFTAGIIKGLLERWDMVRTLRYASALGASATRAAGATDSVFSAAEAEAFIADNPIRVTHEA